MQGASEPTGGRVAKIDDVNEGRKRFLELITSLKSSNGSSNTEKGLPISKAELAQQLFATASAEFLTKTPTEQLREITETAAQTLLPVVSGSSPLVTMIGRMGQRSAIFMALNDRPFIVNTISEFFRHQQTTINTHLHPILNLKSQLISLNYIELDPLSDEALERLKSQLSSSMRDLIPVTDDFPKMVETTNSLASVISRPEYAAKFKSGDLPEISELLKWFADGNFVFLGHAVWQVANGRLKAARPEELMGMFRSDQEYSPRLIDESREAAEQVLALDLPFALEKLRTSSTIHRLRHITHLSIVELDGAQKPVAVHSVIGLLTSKAHSQECSTIPLVRARTTELLKRLEVIEQSHDHKNIVDLIDRMPTEESLRSDLRDLNTLVEVSLRSANHHDIKVHSRIDQDLLGRARGVSVVVVLPRERFTPRIRNSIRQSIESLLGTPRGAAQFHLDLSNKPQSRLYYYAPTELTLDQVKLLIPTIHTEVLNQCRTWQENLEHQILMSDTLGNKYELVKRYRDAFGSEYQALVSPEECASELTNFEALGSDTPIKVDLSYANPKPNDCRSASNGNGKCSLGATEQFLISIYSLEHEVTISKAVPIFENTGLEVVSEQSLKANPVGKGQVNISRFLVRSLSEKNIDLSTFESILAPGLSALLFNRVSDKPLNSDELDSLMLSEALALRSIAVLRSYCYMLWQVNKNATRKTVLQTLAAHPASAKLFWQIFDTMFNPDLKLSTEDRASACLQLKERYLGELKKVADITKDRILRALLTLLSNTVRTNYYIYSDGRVPGEISFKLSSEQIDILPLPKPKYEIYMFGDDMEGVHLRSSSVARGGIRWSDRHEDFRHEVLGLMKTQKIKNVVIVPSGAKGGFIVKYPPKDPAQLPATVEHVYSRFIGAMLAITDNLKQGKVVPPARVIRYDQDDPYFVVAADKGTATFSDLANRLATDQFSFWLGDAFASGGSNGYDHKLYGITARGAWECSKRLFQDAGIDYESSLFTVIGIGDMSGDVFGNGLLMSAHMVLLAAFNHKHVFVDPTPDHQSAYQERLRLFRLPRSQWSDYNKELISKGGGVFGRADKEITITPEMRQALSIPSNVGNVVSGEELVQLVLKAKADLLWNGGIGTYVKAEYESNIQVQDSANDAVRVNATELRVKCIAEGGNLGFTQGARIEFAQQGGFINTDAIDNSGGVDLSDHEVNLKILFSSLVSSGKLSLEERNALLKQISSDVVELVLNNNRSHALILSIGELRSRKNMEYFQSLVRFLSKQGVVNRALEKLPDDEEFQDRIGRGKGLTRPEIAVCCAATKMWLKELIITSDLPEDPALEPFLMNYFPKIVVERWPEQIRAHSLSRNIIATEMVNALVDEVGVTFVHRMSTLHAKNPVSVIKSWAIANLLLGNREHKFELRKIDKPEFAAQYKSCRMDLGSLTRRFAEWILTRLDLNPSIAKVNEHLANTVQSIISNGISLLNSEEQKRHAEIVRARKELKLNDSSANILSLVPWIESLLEVARIAKQCGAQFNAVAADYNLLNRELLTTAIMRPEQFAPARNRWERELLLSAVEELKQELARILIAMRSLKASDDKARAEAIRLSPGYEGIRGVLEEISGNAPDAAAVAIVVKHLRQFVLKC